MQKYHLFLIFLLIFSCSECPVPFSYELADQFTVSYGSRAIAIDSEQGYIYVANTEDNLVNQYNLKGDEVQTLVDFNVEEVGKYEFYYLSSLVVGENGNIYILAIPYKTISDSVKNVMKGFCIIKYNSDGTYQREFDFINTDDAWYPTDLAYENHILYVTNGNRLIKINTENGQTSEFVFQIQDSNHIDPNFIHTTDMAIDDDNNIWLVGQASYNDYQEVGVHITQFDSNCQNQKTFNAKSKSSFFGSALNNPGITFDSDNNMYVTTFYGQSIEIYDFDQEFQREIKLKDEKSLPVDIVIDNNYNLYVLDGINDRILVYQLD